MRTIVNQINPALVKAHKAVKDRLSTDKLYFHPLVIDLPHGRGACTTSFCAMEALNAIETSIVKYKNASTGARLPNKPYYTAPKNDVAQLVDVFYIGTPETIRYCGMMYFQWALEKLRIQKDYTINKAKGYIERKGFGNRIMFMPTSRFRPHMIQRSKPTIIIIDDATQLQKRIFDAIMQTAQNLNDWTGRNSVIMVAYNEGSDPNLNIACSIPSDEKANYLRVHSTYKTVPREWLGETFFTQADSLKKVNPQAYKAEYLGIFTVNYGNGRG